MILKNLFLIFISFLGYLKLIFKITQNYLKKNVIIFLAILEKKMKIKMQTIINICMAVSITLFIYQNDKQQDKINQLQISANFDENILIKLNQIELKINEIDKINNLQQETLEIWQKLLNEKLSHHIPYSIHSFLAKTFSFFQLI